MLGVKSMNKGINIKEKGCRFQGAGRPQSFPDNCTLKPDNFITQEAEL